MAKTALVQKAAAKPKFGVRGYTRCNRCGRPRSVYRKFGLGAATSAMHDGLKDASAGADACRAVENLVKDLRAGTK